MQTRGTDSQVFKRINNLERDNNDVYWFLREETIKSERICTQDRQTLVRLIWDLVILTQIFDQQFVYLFDGGLDDGGGDG